jgi:hypothetical protein
MTGEMSRDGKTWLALATGLQNRCGQNSLIRYLPREVVQYISHYICEIGTIWIPRRESGMMTRCYGAIHDAILEIDRRKNGEKVCTITRIREVRSRKGMSLGSAHLIGDRYHARQAVSIRPLEHGGFDLRWWYYIESSGEVAWKCQFLPPNLTIVWVALRPSHKRSVTETSDGRSPQTIVISAMKALRDQVKSYEGRLDIFDQIDCDIDVIRDVLGPDLIHTILRVYGMAYKHSFGKRHFRETVEQILHDG